MDIAFNADAWGRGERVVRIHHEDLDECHLVLGSLFGKRRPIHSAVMLICGPGLAAWQQASGLH